MSETKNVFDVADWFLQKEDISPKRLQKLVYYVQAWSYTLFNEPFMYEDGEPAQFEAWKHGPVNPPLYNEYKGNGWHKIHLVDKKNKHKTFAPMELDLLESVWETYGEYSPNEIENLTHAEQPWIKARDRDGVAEGDSSNEVIRPEDMKSYYGSVYIGD